MMDSHYLLMMYSSFCLNPYFHDCGHCIRDLFTYCIHSNDGPNLGNEEELVYDDDVLGERTTG